MNCELAKNNCGYWPSGRAELAVRSVRGNTWDCGGEVFPGGRGANRGEVRRDEVIAAMFVRPGAEIFWI